MFEEFLPIRVAKALNLLNRKGLREIRIRVKQPVMVDYGTVFYLSENGLCDQKEYALICSYEEMQEIIFKACECSIYAYAEELKMLFVSLKNGQRMGVCGEVVYDENGNVKTVKNFSSIAIRIAHQIPNCSLKALTYLSDENGFVSTLILSSPGCGKTTFLRDLCYQLSNKNMVKNLLLIDERGEIASNNQGEVFFNVGEKTDILSFTTKSFGIENGIRVFAPNVIAMDELARSEDVDALNFAIGSGVKIIATAHAQNIKDFSKKPLFKKMFESKVFDRFVVLSNRDGVGTLEGIYNANMGCLYKKGVL